MKTAVITLIALMPLAAQEIKMPPSLDRLAAKASEVVDVTMDSSLLQMASKFLSDKDADEAKAKKLVAGLKGIYVKSFEFDKAGEYDMADIEAIRSQLRPPAWSRIVGVKSRKNGDNAEVYLKSENGKISGLTVISTEPKQLTIVNIVGTIDPEELSDLGGHFGIPKMDGASGKKSDKGKDD
jgi:hypothetical protein